jgi:hypothetical protein
VEAALAQSCALTNVERRDDILFLTDRYEASSRRPLDVLDDDERRRFGAGDARAQRRLFFKLLCYGALATQPAPEAVVQADWRRLAAVGLVDDVFDNAFDPYRFALASPITRPDSKGKVIDFLRLAGTRDQWSRLLPQPADPDTVVDLLYACSGGALKSRAFWVVREMLRHELWPGEGLTRQACVPDGRVRKRAARMGLVDLPERSDTLDDMKAFSAALHAVLGLAGAEARASFDLPLSLADQRCEVCDEARMAACPLPHCRWRRAAGGA